MAEFGVTDSVTSRNGILKIYEYHMYIQERKGNMKIWRCRISGCRGRMTLVEGLRPVVTQHSHLPDRAKTEAHLKVVQLKNRAAETLETPRQMTQIISKGMPIQVAAKLPSDAALQRMCQRQRKGKNHPEPPSTFGDINLDHLQQTLRNEQFLIYPKAPDDSGNVLIFSTAENIRHLSRSDVWIADGTFDVAPKPFLQLYTIQGNVGGKMTPLVYGLLPNKCAATYKIFYQAVDDAIAEQYQNRDVPQPGYILIDFEQAALIVLRRIFKRTTIQGCLFHFGQNIYRKLQQLGLSTRYITEFDFNTQCKMLMALAFVPVNDVIKVYETFLAHPKCLFKKTDPFILYFERVYIGEVVDDRRGRRRKAPNFAIEFWNCHDRLLGDIQRTTNNIEGWHNAFGTTAGCVHPDLYTFFDKLQMEQNYQEGRITKITGGQPPAKQRQTYRDVTDRLMAVAINYGEMDPLEYLVNISKNLEINFKYVPDE